LRKLVGLIALAAIAAVVLGSVAASGSNKSAEKVRLILLNTRSFSVDNSPSGTSPGDLFGASGPLKRGRKRIGNLISSCTLASTKKVQGQCAATFSLKRLGSLELAGKVTQTPSFTVAIIGGTGDFRRAAGTATVRSIGDGSRQHVSLRILDR
jgi:dirigent-like protein